MKKRSKVPMSNDRQSSNMETHVDNTMNRTKATYTQLYQLINRGNKLNHRNKQNSNQTNRDICICCLEIRSPITHKRTEIIGKPIQ